MRTAIAQGPGPGLTSSTGVAYVTTASPPVLSEERTFSMRLTTTTGAGGTTPTATIANGAGLFTATAAKIRRGTFSSANNYRRLRVDTPDYGGLASGEAYLVMAINAASEAAAITALTHTCAMDNTSMDADTGCIFVPWTGIEVVTDEAITSVWLTTVVPLDGSAATKQYGVRVRVSQ